MTQTFGHNSDFVTSFRDMTVISNIVMISELCYKENWFYVLCFMYCQYQGLYVIIGDVQEKESGDGEKPVVDCQCLH